MKGKKEMEGKLSSQVLGKRLKAYWVISRMSPLEPFEHSKFSIIRNGCLKFPTQY